MSVIRDVEQLVQFLRGSLVLLRSAQDEGMQAIQADPLRWDGLERRAELAIQACVDTADQVLGAEGLEEPPRSRDVFAALASGRILDVPLARRLGNLVDLRNRLAHRYLQVTPEELWGRLPEIIESATAFADAMVAWIGGP